MWNGQRASVINQMLEVLKKIVNTTIFKIHNRIHLQILQKYNLKKHKMNWFLENS